MAQNLGDNVTIYDYYAKNGYTSGYVNGGGETEFTSYTLIANQSMTLTGRVRALSDDTTLPAVPVFQAPKIIINNTGSIGILIRSDNPNNKITFNDSSVNFDNAIYNGNNAANRIGPISFTGTSSINITPNTNGKTIIKASTLTGTVTLDVDEGVQDGDTFLIEATDNQLVITDGEWSATASTSGNVTTYTLAKSEPVPVPVIGKYNKKLLRKKLALMLANLKKKRKYYCEVECLELTGTQGIDTGISGNLNTSYEIMAKTTQTTNVVGILFGSRSSATSNNISSLYPADGGNVVNDFGNYNSTRQAYLPVGTFPKLKIYNSKNKRSVTNLDTGEYNEVTTTYSTDFTTPNNLHIGLKTSGYVDAMVSFSGYIYGCKIWDNGTLVRDFIPVLDWNMTPCMFDRVTEQLFYNAGTGDFSYGREIHYVDYLELDGNQYIDTGIKPNNNTSVEIDYQLTQATQTRAGLFGALNMTGSNQGRFGSILSPSNSYMEHGYGSGNDYWQQGMPDTNRHLLYQKKNEVYFDGTLIHTFNTATFSLAINAYLGNFVYTNYTPAKAKYYGSRWWDGNTLVRDYKPAIDENGVCFWFDRISHTIYDNAGTDVFKYPARETEYTANAGTPAYIDLGAKYKSSMSIRGKFTRDGMGASGSVLLVTNTTTAPLIYFPALQANAKQDRYVWRRPGYNEQNYFLTFDDYPVTQEAVLDAVNDTLTVNGNLVKTGMIAGMNGYSSPYESSSNMYMFSIAENYAGDGKIYYLQIDDGSTPVFDLIPAYKDGQAGFYNKITGIFYGNVSTNANAVLTGGKIIEPEYE